MASQTIHNSWRKSKAKVHKTLRQLRSGIQTTVTLVIFSVVSTELLISFRITNKHFCWLVAPTQSKPTAVFLRLRVKAVTKYKTQQTV